MNDIFTAFWFFLPVGVANSAPVIVMVIPGLQKLNYPMDFNISFRGKRVFGSHKTFRGLIAGIIVSIIVVTLQQHVYSSFPDLQEIISINYKTINPIIFGTLCASGALLGDAVESFFKRQIGIKPGESWFPFDQIDYIIGGIIATSLYRSLPLAIYVYIVVLWFGMHLLFSWLGFILKLKNKPI